MGYSRSHAPWAVSPPQGPSEPILALPSPSQLVAYSAHMTWPWLQRGWQLKYMAIFWGHDHQARRPELRKRVAGAGATQKPGAFCARRLSWS